ncbi:photosystem reaction center subunit H [Thermoleptolyngbya oregonensis NK1-22]|uniref:Photosystem reaction center subunit H n=1 Tax=Thermoleptolyngbya oregonensis NK1-22 TaxID=2547457 RepID=A0AA96Y755_9CYAN|nr:photosystem reaction center subunit H [Thermoleptolyngbya oregonensis NK1-22]
MFNIIRRSQIVGLVAMDGSTATRLGGVEEVWVDGQGRVVYFASSAGYTPLEQISLIGPDAVLTYSDYAVEPSVSLRRLCGMRVRTPSRSDILGWIEDFLFDWETGDIAAYVLGGEIAAPFGGRAVLFPEDVEVIDADYVLIKEDAKSRLQGESEGLQGFLSEKSQQVKNLVKHMSDRLKSLVSPDDHPDVVRVKIRKVCDEFAGSKRHDKNALQEAVDFLQDKWEDLQKSLYRASDRTKQAIDSAWKRLMEKPGE